MPAPHKGELLWNVKRINLLADELKGWMGKWDAKKVEGNWNVQQFAVMKEIPYQTYFLSEFQKKSFYFRSVMEWALDAMEVRFNLLVGEGKIPPTYAALVAKNKFGYRDRQDLNIAKPTDGKKDRKERVKGAIRSKLRRPDSK